MKAELKKILAKVNSGIDWSVKELPDVAKQVLRWGIIENAITLFFNFILGVISFLLIKKGTLWVDDHWGNINWCMIGGVIIGVTFFIMFWCIIHTFAKIIVSPKLYLIEKIKELIE